MMSCLQAKKLTFGALKFAELDRRSERYGQRLELTAETFKCRRVATEAGRIYLQPLANVVEAVCR